MSLKAGRSCSEDGKRAGGRGTLDGAKTGLGSPIGSDVGGPFGVDGAWLRGWPSHGSVHVHSE